MKLFSKLFAAILGIFGVKNEAKADYFDRLSWHGRWLLTEPAAGGGRTPLYVRILPADTERADMVTQSLRDWEKATEGAGAAVKFFVLAPGAALKPADITLDLTWASPTYPKKDGYAETNRTEGILTGATVYLATQCPTKNLRRLACHEIGHALGIGGHSDDERDVMHSPVRQGKPTARDVRTLVKAWEAAAAEAEKVKKAA